jgi:hypothetical protein
MKMRTKDTGEEMINNRIYPYYMLNKRGTQPLSASHTGEVIEWCMVILPIVLGLPALYCLLAMGGVFAYVGPWLIFGATIFYSKRLQKGQLPSFYMFNGNMLNGLLSSFNSIATKKLDYTLKSYSSALLLLKGRRGYKRRAKFSRNLLG